MRAIFIGAGSLSVMTAQILLKRGHEAVIIERDREIINSLSSELDCGFLHGDGSKPAILRETNPGEHDILFCLTGNDQTNILASLVGRSLGFQQVVTKIEDPELEHICIELGLEDTIIPARTIGRFLSDMAEGRNPLEMTTLIREDARVFSFVLPKEQADTTINEINLPGQSRIICIYRDNKLIIPDDSEKLKEQDEVVIVTHRKNLEKLTSQWIKT